MNAGADIIKTCSFNSNRFSQEKYETQEFVYQMNLNAAKIAKEVCCEVPFNRSLRLVAGAIGPTNNRISPDNYDSFVEVYYEQINGLCVGGVDILLIETVVNTLSMSVTNCQYLYLLLLIPREICSMDRL